MTLTFFISTMLAWLHMMLIDAAICGVLLGTLAIVFGLRCGRIEHESDCRTLY